MILYAYWFVYMLIYYLLARKYISKYAMVIIIIMNIWWLVYIHSFVLFTVDSKILYDYVLQNAHSINETISLPIFRNFHSDIADLTFAQILRLPALPYYVFNYLVGIISFRNPFVAAMFLNIYFTFSVTLFLKSIRDRVSSKNIFYYSIAILLISPTMFFYSHQLHKEAFVVATCLMSAAFFIKKKFFSFFIFFVIATFSRVYSFLAIFSYIFIFYYELHNYKLNIMSVTKSIRLTKNLKLKINYSNISLLLIAVGCMVALFHLINNFSLLTLEQGALMFVALFATPVFYKLSNYESFICLATCESIFLLFLLFLLFYFILKKGKLYHCKENLVIVTLLLSFVSILAVEGAVRYILIPAGGGWMGDEINRKRSLMLPLMYFLLFFNLKYYAYGTYRKIITKFIK